MTEVDTIVGGRRGPVLGWLLQLSPAGGWRFDFSRLRGSSVLVDFLPLLSFGLDRFELVGGTHSVPIGSLPVLGYGLRRIDHVGRRHGSDSADVGTVSEELVAASTTSVSPKPQPDFAADRWILLHGFS